MDFKTELSLRTEETEKIIKSFLPEETGFQKTIFEACNYSVNAGGKRLRPIIMKETAALCGGAAETQIGPFMAAIEMIHSSSLVHDDLPCMDNDRLRRGRLSTWAEFGEDMGTLAGDGLMIYAFETACKSDAPADRKLEAIRILSEKTGIYGMIGGQTVDVELTGGSPSKEELLFIYRLKTGALLEASFMIGAVLAGADSETVEKLERAAGLIGLAFQIRDDILDEISTAEELGKPIGSDAENNKITWLTYYGMEQSEKDVRSYTEEAMQIIKGIGDNTFLEELLGYLVSRKN